MQNQFYIRDGVLSDAPIILAFIHGIAEFEQLSHEVQASINTIEAHFFGETPYVKCLLAFENDIAVGFALYYLNYSSFVAKPGLYLEDLYIVPTHRHKGYGKQLMQQLIAKANQLKCGRMEWNVLKWNQKAIDWYEKLGAQALSEWTTYRLNEKDLKTLNDEGN